MATTLHWSMDTKKSCNVYVRKDRFKILTFFGILLEDIQKISSQKLKEPSGSIKCGEFLD
jgi:hypothetical protein